MQYKKVFVTGSSGFLGSHVADVLEEQGYKVVLFDTVTSKYKSKTQKEIIGNIMNPGDIEKAISGCDAIYHFAAQADIDSATSGPMHTINTNIMGTQNILEVARKNNIKRILFASTI